MDNGNIKLVGIGVSQGITAGPAYIKESLRINTEKVLIVDAEAEILRLNQAKKKCQEQLERIYRDMAAKINPNEAEIFNAQKMMLEDPEYFGGAEEKIRSEKVNAEFAVHAVSQVFIEMLRNMDNIYLRERAQDIKDVSIRLIKTLYGTEESRPCFDKPVILLADELTPSDTASLDRKSVLGFITKYGGKTSHTAIMARTLNIPAIAGVGDAFDQIATGDSIIMDGEAGVLFVNPDERISNEYQEKIEEQNRWEKIYHKMKGQKTVTQDGIQMELGANIGTTHDITSALENDAEGVGLFRTEFLYMNREKLPDEEIQFQAYKKAATMMAGKPVIIRTLDIGGDKELPYLNIEKEENPALGFRAIRFSFKYTDIFEIQLRAILRASVFGNIKIMFPMISGIDEFRKAKEYVESVKRDLKREMIEFNDNIEIGTMIEIPSAAILSDLLAKEADFFSIGTNDLIQYTVAVDRGNRKVSDLYNYYNPAVLRLIALVSENARKENKWVGICGELAGNPKLIPLFAGVGIRELSMSPASILRARWIISNTSAEQAKKLTEDVLKASSAQEVENLLK